MNLLRKYVWHYSNEKSEQQIFFSKRNNLTKYHENLKSFFNETACLISGGYLNSGITNTVMRFDSNNLNNGHTYVKSMVYERSTFACTIFKSSAHNGRPVAIAAGSFYGADGADKAEIWDFSQEGTTWQESKIIFALVLPLLFISFCHRRGNECNGVFLSKVYIIISLLEKGHK